LETQVVKALVSIQVVSQTNVILGGQKYCVKPNMFEFLAPGVKERFIAVRLEKVEINFNH
jgi:hypothetical protein